jgi:hypothetical protein
VDPDAVRPRAYQTELGIEQQLPGTINFSATWVFTRGVKLPAQLDVNLAPATVTKTYDVVNAAGVTQFTSAVPFYTTRLDSSVGAFSSEVTPLSSRYNGLVVTARKPMSHGVEILANYTLSKATDNGAAPFAAGGRFSGNEVIDPFDLKVSEGYSGAHVPHRFTASVIWQPNLGAQITNPVGRTILGGWSVSSSITATKGHRYNAQVSSAAVQCQIRGTAGSSSCVGAPGLDGGMTAALLRNISVPAPGFAYWLPRNSFALPGYANFDLRIAKRFALTERFNFDFRGEMFNVFNSTLVLDVSRNAYNYGQPSGSSSAVCKNLTADPVNGHTNTCMVPLAAFQTPTVTSGALLGARQIQFGATLSF